MIMIYWKVLLYPNKNKIIKILPPYINPPNLGIYANVIENSPNKFHY